MSDDLDRNREPFVIGRIDDDPGEACERMGWTVLARAGDSFGALAYSADGRQFKVNRGRNGFCVAQEIAS